MPSYAKVPEFGQLVEYVTQTQEVDGVCGVMINKIPITQHNLEDVRSLDAIKADYQKVEIEYKRPADLLSEKELGKLKVDYALDAKLTAVYPAQIIELLKIAASKVDVANIEVVK